MASILNSLKSLLADNWKAAAVGAAAVWLFDHGGGSLIADLASSALGLK